MIFFPLFFISWGLLAVYCGFALAFAAERGRSSARRYLPLAAAIVILGCTIVFLFDQYFFTGLVLKLGVSLVELVLLFGSLAAYWKTTSRPDRRFRTIILATLLISLFWLAAGVDFFLPLLFVPAGSLFTAHLGFAAVFAVIMLGTGAILRSQAKSSSSSMGEIETAPSGRSRPQFPLVLIGGVLVAMVYFSSSVQTMIILKKRDHTFLVDRAVRALGISIPFQDSMRAEENESSIYPADLGIKSARAYIEFLLANHYLDRPLPVDVGELDIGNVSRNDAASTILVRSNRVQYDIHTMINNLGGVPDYARGFILMRKDGKGDFYRDDMKGRAGLGSDPPRAPAFLPTD